MDVDRGQDLRFKFLSLRSISSSFQRGTAEERSDDAGGCCRPTAPAVSALQHPPNSLRSFVLPRREDRRKGAIMSLQTADRGLREDRSMGRPNTSEA